MPKKKTSSKKRAAKTQEAQPDPAPSPESPAMLDDLPSFQPMVPMLEDVGADGLEPLGAAPRLGPSRMSLLLDELPPLGPLPEVKSTGVAILKQLTDLAVGGTINQGDANRLAALVEGFQTRIDLANIGGSIANMERMADLTTMISRIEQKIMEELPNLPIDFALNFLKTLQKDRLATATILGVRSTTPTISSPGNLSGSVVGGGKQDQQQQEAKTLISAEGRKRVSSIFQQLQSKIIETKAVVVESDS